jgi:hypothetical protein
VDGRNKSGHDGRVGGAGHILALMEKIAMNIHATARSDAAISPAEWEARVDLAAVYRLVAHHGWDDVIYNERGGPDSH